MSINNSPMAGAVSQISVLSLGKLRRSVPFSYRSAINLVGFVFLLGMGITAYVSIQSLERHHRSKAGEDLATILTTVHVALGEWVREKTLFVESYANSDLIKNAVLASSEDSDPPMTLEARLQISERIHNAINNSDHTEIPTNFHILSKDSVKLFSSYPKEVDSLLHIPENRRDAINKVWQGESVLIPPFWKPASDIHEKNTAVLLIATPLELEGIVAAIAVLEIGAKDAFTRFAATGRLGESGETYFFDAQATMLTVSRFNRHLQEIGLLKPGEISALNIEIREPTVTVTSNPRQAAHSEGRPLTVMAKSAISGKTGTNTDGYLDYRGISVFGAWLWDNQLGIGIAVEIDEPEAMSNFQNVKVVIALVCGASAAISIGLFLMVLLLRRGLDNLTARSVRFGRILEGSLNEIYVFGSENYKFIEVNKGARRNLGYSMEKMKELTAWGIKPEIDEPQFRALVQPLINGEKEVLQFETIHQRKNGTRYPVEVHLQLFADETPPVFVAIIMDVSERKESEKAAFNSEHILSEAQRIAHIGSWQWDIQSGDLGWSDEIFRIFGYEPQSINPTYGAFLDIIHPDDRAEVEGAVQKALDEKQTYSIEHRLVHPDSTLRWVHEQGEASYAEDGTPLTMLGTVLDITERKRVEDLNNRFGRIFESSLNEIYVFDGETCNFVHVNESARRNLGYSMEEMTGMTAWGIKPEIEESKFRTIVQSLIDGEKDVLVFETIHQRKNGTCYPVEVHLQLFADETPKVFVAIIMDISERKEVEEAILKLNQDLEKRVDQRTAELKNSNEELSETLADLKRMQGQLVESEKMASLGGLVAGVAHEINTPIGIGVTAASHLKEENETFEKAYRQNSMKRSDLEAYVKQSSDSVTIIEANLRRAADLIRSFKNVAVDQMSEVPREFELAEYLGEVLLSLNPKLKQGSHKVELDCDPSIRVHGQPGVFSQIITNLIMNSLIHAFDDGESGRMSIEVHQIGNEIEIRYKDFGKGIPKDQVSRVFEPFFTTRRGQGGSGLGLHIIYNLVTQKLGGTISCESETGCGTCFTIKFSTN